MDEESLKKVCCFANALKQSAHLLLHHHHHLVLDTHSLGELQQAFSLILEMEQHTTFHVLPPNHRLHPAVPHLQRAYDLLQKVEALALRPPASLPQHAGGGGDVVSLRCFRNIVSLEVSGVDVTRLGAVRPLRARLRRLVATSHSLTCLADLFLRCGADQSDEYNWEKLVEVTLSHNALRGGTLDSSLSLLPAIQVLDISHCGLHDVTHLSHLSTLTHLDLSHNNLQHLPLLPPSSCPSLAVLIVSHNAIRHLGGLQHMISLQEVNLGHNLLTSDRGLVTLAALPRLRSLVLTGNPVACNPTHRTTTLRLLHPGVVGMKFLLDNFPLTPYEQQVLGSSTSPPPLLHSLSSPSTSSLQTFDQGGDPLPIFSTTPVQEPGMTAIGTRRRSRKRRTRHIALGEEEEEEGEGESAPPSLSHPSSYLYIPPTPPTINSTNLFYLPDDTCAPPSSDLVKEEGHLTSTPPSDTLLPKPSEEQNERLLEEILQAHSPQSPASLPPLTTTTTTTTSSIITPTTGDEVEKEVVVVEEEEEERSKKKGEEEKQEEDEGFYKSVMKEDSSYLSSDKEEEEEEACLVLAQRLEEEEEEEREGGGEERDVILSVASTQFKEKHFVSTKTLYRWDLRCVESIEELPQHNTTIDDTSRVDDSATTTTTTTTKVRMTFDTSRRFHRSRIYKMEREDYFRLRASLSPSPSTTACDTCKKSCPPGTSNKDRCLRCSQESWQPSSRPPITSTPLHHYANNNGSGLPPLPLLEAPPPPITTSSTATPGTLTSPMQESSSSGSLTGSVCTAYERGGTGVPSSLPLTPHKAPATSHPSSPSHLDTDVTDSSTLYLSAESSLPIFLSPSPPPLPSSSGGTLTKKEEEEEEEEEEEDEKGELSASGKLVSIVPWIETILHTYTGYHWQWWEDIEAEDKKKSTNDKKKKRRRRTNTLKEEQNEENGEDSTNNTDSNSDSSNSNDNNNLKISRPHNPISYNYEDLQQVDHRLKLYLEVVVLKDPEEYLLGLVKAVMFISGSNKEFQGILVFSSVKYYLMQIVGPESDSPQDWLEEVGRGRLEYMVEVCSLYQRQGVALSLSPSPTTSTTTTTSIISNTTTTLLLVVFSDSHRSNCFFNFLMDALGGRGASPKIVEAAPTQEALLGELLGEEESDDTQPSLLVIVSLLTDDGRSESQYLIINETELVLCAADLSWYVPTTTTTTADDDDDDAPAKCLNTTLAQKMYNVTGIEVHSPHHLSLHFLEDESQQLLFSSWHLHLASPTTACHIIQAISPHWTQLFSVPLQVTHHTSQPDLR